MASDDELVRPEATQPEQWIGSAMRRAREAGALSLRSMAKRLGYHSHTTLLTYERGGSMATDEVVKGYEQVLGLEPGTLVSVLEEARLERHGDVFAKRRVHPSPPSSSVTPIDPPAPANPSRYAWSRRRRTLITVTAGLFLVFGVIGIYELLRHRSNVTADSPAVIVPDGSDPKVTGCAVDAETVDAIDVYGPPQYLVGLLELRASPRCGTIWGKFTQSAGLPQSPTLMIHIDVHRPADAASARFQIRYAGQGVYGDQLVSFQDCVYAEMTIEREGQTYPPTRTRCVRSR
ncbi:helix-turn-helix domain-containing protein [Sphaerisporangium sp. B11E5]|uniref:helix-turn-helix domain-containing protein n=1 Tax=Sphaerisporangium sp. B11E5 TaxID=3153563 RepID=UPI00325E491A